jgi:hypothetical protein
VGRQGKRVFALASAVMAIAALSVGAASAAAETTKVFTFTGAEQTFTVPSGVTKIHVVAIGGRGGKSGNTGGAGAQVEGSLAVKPGQTLYVEVGGIGGTDFGENELSAGGFNGGGAGAGGGGGASDLRTNPREEGLSPDTRLIVAAGGGGSGSFGEFGAGAGGNAGNAGESIPSNEGGGAGTAEAGGSGGSGGCVPGEPGGLGQGGNGGNCKKELGFGFIGGGGGGGLYGGGGGGAGGSNGGAGGGGGASLVPPGGALEIAPGAAPEIRISFESPPPPVEEPEIGRCVATTGGKYTNATCLTAAAPGTGKYEWEPFPFTKAGFSLTNGTATFKTVVAKTTISCAENVVAGEYTGIDSATLKFTYSGCKVLGPFGGVCTGAKAEAGEFSTEPLAADFGTIDSSVSPVSLGWAVHPAKGETFAAFECGGTAVTITGSVIAPVTPINKMTASFKLAFSAPGGVQKPTSFQGGEEQVLTLHTVNATEVVGLTMADSIANERLVELRAN